MKRKAPTKKQRKPSRIEASTPLPKREHWDCLTSREAMTACRG